MDLLNSSLNWLMFGLVLMILETITGTFYLICFGVAAMVVAALTYLFDLGFVGQLISFAGISPVVLKILLSKFKKNKKDLKVGQSEGEAIGKLGHIVGDVNPMNSGIIHFGTAIMGSRSWLVVSEETIKIGEAARVIGIEGNYLRVERYHGAEAEMFSQGGEK
jgi:membrane protein implicated in regulation of membrane protease activity